MHSTQTRLRHGALAASAAVLALLAAGCSKASAGAQAGGCRADVHWPEREQTAWLRTAVTFRDTADGDNASYEKASVVIGAQPTGDVRPLCRPLAVQVEFWTLTATAAGSEMSFVMRYQLSTDGSRTRTVGFPVGLPTVRDVTCTRVLVAAYPGPPLTDGEQPRTTRDPAATGDTGVRFGTKRIGAYRLLPARGPAQCDADRSTPSPSPTGTTGWNIYHP
ncbi:MULTISPECIES: hypothetical protein [unclassified Streptomyces]|uniref:hypothetical protein n=1 Tax=unclassified Streptomyces TaxID=2593676 RepID=UPI0022566D11|nr:MULTISPECIES: hypothetical protein [unclassified Streptomyces]MCX5062786.1 hypothetical protein [Streptomyces sp. NBC_00452]MCX5291608.1 hypothetical protein [Streptomyces sp. NBC_00183]